MTDSKLEVCFDCLNEVEIKKSDYKTMIYCKDCYRRNAFSLSLTEDQIEKIADLREQERYDQLQMSQYYSTKIDKATFDNLILGIIIGIGFAPVIFKLKDLLGL